MTFTEGDFEKLAGRVGRVVHLPEPTQPTVTEYCHRVFEDGVYAYTECGICGERVDEAEVAQHYLDRRVADMSTPHTFLGGWRC